MIYKNLTTDEIAQLEFQAGKKATELIDGIKEDMKGKLDAELSAADNGKILQVGADGKVTPMAPASGLTIDDTLTVEGAAADAKAAGEKIGSLNRTVFSALIAEKTPSITLTEKKYIQTSGNIATSSDYNVRSFSVEGVARIKLTTSNFAGTRNLVVAAFYTSNSAFDSTTFIRYTDIIQQADRDDHTYIYDVPETAKSVVFACSRTLSEGSQAPYALVFEPIKTADVMDYAKTISDKLNSIADYYGEPYGVSWVIGGIASTGDGQLSLKYMLRTTAIVEIPADGYIQATSGYKLRVFWYTDTSTGYTASNLIKKTDYTTAPVQVAAGDKIGVVIVDPMETVQTDLSMIQYVDWHIYLKTIREVMEELSDESSPFYRNINIRRGDVSQYYWGLAQDYSSVVCNSSTKYSDMIAHYDALMALHPDYITKKTIGSGSGTDAGGDPYTLYEYVFAPRKLTNAQDNTIRAKILMDAGIHGFEKNAVAALYYFMEDICERWQQNPSLAALRWRVEFHVIPISNPHGFDNNNYVNGNGVNLARNFPCEGWVPVYEPSTQVNGETPLDQPEAQAIANMISENQDAFLYLNLHTNGQTDVAPNQSNNIQLKTGIDDDYYNRQFSVAAGHIERQSALIPSEYQSVALPASSFIGRYLVTSDNKKGQVDTYCVEWLKLMMASVFEVFNGMAIDGETVVTGRSPDSKKMCSEMIGNYILSMLYEYGK